jgi:hypothetical protein
METALERGATAEEVAVDGVSRAIEFTLNNFISAAAAENVSRHLPARDFSAKENANRPSIVKRR